MPPHSRRADGSSSAAAFSLNAEASGPAGRLGVFRPKPLVPGAAPPDTKSASKNARRRKKKGPGGEVADTAAEEDPGTQTAGRPDQSDGVHAVSHGRAQSSLAKHTTLHARATVTQTQNLIAPFSL